MLCSSSTSVLPRTITILHSHAITVSRRALFGSFSSNPRRQDAKTTNNTATDPKRRPVGVGGSDPVTSICSMFKSRSTWDPALESTLESICSSRGLTPLQAMNVIICLENPELGFNFFKFTKTQLGVKHLASTYNIIIVALGRAGQFEDAKRTMEDMKNNGHFLTESILITLVTCQARADKVDEAIELFNQAEYYNCKPTIFSYNRFVSLLIEKNGIQTALGFFRDYLCRNICPDLYTFNILIKGLSRAGHADEGFKLLEVMGNYGFSPDSVTFNTLINGLCRVGKVKDGYRVLSEMQSGGKCRPDVVSYTSVILGYCRLGMLDEAVRVLNEMFVSGESPNLVTYNILIDGFCKAGNMEEAYSLFRKTVDRDVVTYTTMVDGYCKDGQVDESIKLFHEMTVRGLVPNVYTYAVMINGLCKENRLSEACDILRQMRESGVIGRPFIYNPVIDGFCKAGNVDGANKVVEEMQDTGCRADRFTYTIMIVGHCMKGRMSEAINLFHEMLRVGCYPDSVSVQALVYCLIKAGMPNEAMSVLLTVLEKGCTSELLSCRSITNEFLKLAKESDAAKLIKDLWDKTGASLASSQLDTEVWRRIKDDSDN